MAYGVRWYSYFSDLRDAGEGNYLVEVLDRDYAGAAVRVKSYGDPCEVAMQDVSDPFEPVRSLKFSFNWIAEEGVDFDISQLFITDDLKYRIQLSKLDEEDNAEVLFHGYVSPINAEEPFLPKRYAVSFAATCGLPLLRDASYLDAFGSFVEGELSLIKIIANCLSTTEFELPIHTTINMYEAGMSLASSPLSQAIIDADGLRGMKAYDVLSRVLTSLRAFIVQSNGAWNIIRVKEQSLYTGKVWKFNSNGDAAGSEMRVHAAAFGKKSYLPEVPRVYPINKSVKKSLAMRNSVVTATVDPGIPVNRLANGTFSGPVFGTIPGWNNHMGLISWTRAGAGRPDDPYRVEFPQHVELIPGAKKSLFQPWAYFDSGPIEFNLGDFNIPEESRKETKIVLRGAMKMWNVLGASIMISLNEVEREFGSYLNTEGDWYYSKKEARTYDIRSIQPTQGRYIDTRSYHDEDLQLQTFEIESKRITNYLNVGGNAIVKLRIRIFPGAQFPHYVGAQAFVSLEDLMVYVVEDSKFEGQHKYRIDAKSKIRNPNPADFTMMVADKIDITTPEQSRDVNRVMTGYMTLPGGALTKSWRSYLAGGVDPGDSIQEPIQKKALRETVRLLCGRRDVYEGIVGGYGLLPIHTVYNAYDEPADPSKFHTITQWKWKPRDMEYTVKFSELNFEPLDNEDIFLTDDEGGFNRMYRGATSSASGSNARPDIEPIVFDDIPPVYFTVGKQAIRVVDLTAYLMSTHAPYDLDDRELHFTDWVSYVTIDRGEDGDLLDLQITAWPKLPGTDRVLVEFEGPNGEKYILIVPLVAVKETKFTHYLIDRTGGGSVVVGKLKAGSGYMKPDLWQVKTVVDGFHEGYFQSVAGPGAAGATATPYEVVDGADEGEYTIPAAAVEGEAGTYNYEFSTFRNEGDPDLYALVKGDAFSFVLFDEAYLGKLKAELWVGGSKLGDIAPDGSSAFNTEGQAFQIKMIVADLLHDTAVAQLNFGGATVKDHSYLQDPSVEDVTYDLYEVLPAAQPKGRYELRFTADEEGANVYERLIGFTINEKKKTAEGGELKLVAMRANQSSYDVMGTLSLSGGLFAIKPWNVLADAPVVAGTRRSHRLFQKRAGGLVNIDTSLYTGQPQYQDYIDDEDTPEYLIFGSQSSQNIDKIHGDNTSFRVIVTDEVNGVTTEIFQADFSFGTLEDLDDLPVEEPGAQTIVAGYAMGATTTNNVTALNWRPDGVTLETYQPESPDNPEDPAANHARIKLKGVTLGHIQEIPNKTVLGNLSGASAVPQAIEVSGDPDTANPGDLVLFSLIQQILEDSIDGTAGYIPKFGGDGIVDSIIRESAGKIGIGVNPTEVLHVAGNILVTGQLKSSVATGTAPLMVNSTTRVENLNVQYLNGHEGPYYLDWDNFTNYKSIIAGGGLINGGQLDVSRTLDLGVPSSISPTSTNSVTADSHTHALTGVYSETEVDNLLDNKENVFSKGDIIQGAGMDISGASLLNTLVGNDITFALAASGVAAGTYRSVTVDVYGRVTGGANPTTLAGYGLDSTVYTKTQVDALIASAGYIDGSGSAGYIAKFTDSDTIANSVIFDNGSEINIADTRSFGVEGPAAMRDYLHVHGYQSNGTASNHGSIVVHNSSSATAEGCAAIEIRSTSRGLMLPRMTQSQRRSIVGASQGLMVLQTDLGAGGAGVYVVIATSWVRLDFTYFESL